MSNKAIIYCRVSSQKQVEEGTGLSSQEQRCREYCRSKGYLVEKVFHDEGISGGLFERPGMQALLGFISKNRNEQYIVVFDDLKRFARDIEVHLRLRREFDTRHAKLESPNFSFEDSLESRYVEGILALTAQLERNQNQRQVIQKQKARLEQGYWPFCNPPGLKFIRTKEDGKLLIPDEVLAPIYKETLELYANGLIRTQTEAAEFIRQKYKEKNINRKISNHGVNELFKKILYTGYIAYEPWGVSLRKGKHTGFISLETYQKVQGRLAGINRSKPRKNYLEDFALRGFVCCAHCGKPYTASWNTGRNKRYPNYTCKTIGCDLRWKSIPKNSLHADFRRLLRSRKLEPEYVSLAEAVLLDIWSDFRENELRKVGKNKVLQNECLTKVDNLVNLISTANDASLIEIYQQKIQQLKNELTRVNISEDSLTKYTSEQFGTALKKVIQTLENPLATWKTRDVEVKRSLINFYFDVPLTYSRESGFGTAEYRQEIKVLCELGTRKFNMVEMGGIEPPC